MEEKFGIDKSVSIIVSLGVLVVGGIAAAITKEYLLVGMVTGMGIATATRKR